MQHGTQEVEVKFVIANTAALHMRLGDIGAKLVYSKIHELNLLFDNENLKLKQEDCFLRLRKDQTTKITFKGPRDNSEGVTSRLEIELNVSDFETAQKLLEALGYHVYWTYEKYRTTYTIDDLVITLDETPFGDILEIEGPNANSIKELGNRLSLNWNRRLLDTYPAIFQRIKETLNFNFRDLTFENFKSIHVKPNDYLSVAADQA